MLSVSINKFFCPPASNVCKEQGRIQRKIPQKQMHHSAALLKFELSSAQSIVIAKEKDAKASFSFSLKVKPSYDICFSAAKNSSRTCFYDDLRLLGIPASRGRVCWTVTALPSSHQLFSEHFPLFPIFLNDELLYKETDFEGVFVLSNCWLL